MLQYFVCIRLNTIIALQYTYILLYCIYIVQYNIRLYYIILISYPAIQFILLGFHFIYIGIFYFNCIQSASAHSAGPYEMFTDGRRRFVVSSLVVRQLGTKIDHKWDQSGPAGEGKGYPKINKNMKKGRKRKRKEPTYEKQVVFICAAILSKFGALNGQAFNVVL